MQTSAATSASSLTSERSGFCLHYACTSPEARVPLSWRTQGIWRLPGDGIYSTAVGYCAGFTPNPTYEEACSGMSLTRTLSLTPTLS